MKAELLQDARAHLGEGPSWSAADGRLLWVDITAGEVHALDPVTGLDDVVQVGEDVGAVVPTDRPGTVAVAVRRGLGLLADGAVTLLADVHGDDASIRMNDGKADPQGRFVAGSMAYDFAPGAASLYRLEHDGSLTTLLDGLTVSNGLAWSADGRTLWFVDTGSPQVDRLTYGDDGVSGRALAVDLSAEVGSPDGMTVDAEGMLWVAMWGGSAVLRVSPVDGRVVDRVELPVTQPTSCAFGGPDLATLFVTSARYGLGADELALQPEAGGVFAVRTTVPGAAAPVVRLGSASGS